jgi:hypothetical protein
MCPWYYMCACARVRVALRRPLFVRQSTLGTSSRSDPRTRSTLKFVGEPTDTSLSLCCRTRRCARLCPRIVDIVSLSSRSPSPPPPTLTSPHHHVDPPLSFQPCLSPLFVCINLVVDYEHCCPGSRGEEAPAHVNTSGHRQGGTALCCLLVFCVACLCVPFTVLLKMPLLHAASRVVSLCTQRVPTASS